MAKRIIDGEGLWHSDKLSQIEPAWIKAEYANLLPLALANGSFECNSRLVWTRVYAFNRTEIGLDKVEQILDELERVKLLFRWMDTHGKPWGYWVGIEKPGRLPSPSRQARKHETAGPEPPAEQLRSFLQNNGQPMASHSVANGEVGFGSGLGIGIGSGAPATPQAGGSFNSTEAAIAICQANGWSGRQMADALKDAIEHQSKTMPEATLEEVGEWLVRAWNAYVQSKGKFAGSVRTFFTEAKYKSDSSSGNGQQSATNILNDNPATRTMADLMEAD